jgi:hypothetical protein
MISKLLYRNGDAIRKYAFSIEEANDNNINYIKWKDVVKLKPSHENTIWVISDDDIVLEVHSIAKIGKAHIVITYFGRFFTNETDEYKMNIINQNKTKPHPENKNTLDTHIKHIVATFASRGMDITDIVEYLKPSERQNKKIRKFFSSTECISMVKQELKGILDRYGITEETVIENLIEINEQAVLSKNLKARLSVIKEYMDLLGMKEKETQVRKIGYNEIDKLDGIKRELLLEEKKVIDNS